MFREIDLVQEFWDTASMRIGRKSLLCILVGVLLLGIVLVTPIRHRVLLILRGQQTVEQAVAALDDRMSREFPQLADAIDGRPIALVAIKDRQQLEVWKRNSQQQWRRLRSYPFTGTSGGPGPKLKRGDGQIPEGIYRIVSLNPNSRFHLSMELDYPNEFDHARGLEDGRGDLGDQIFIHGSDATVGCIPIGDRAIEELFYLIARNGPENTTVLILPCDLRTEPAPSASPPWTPSLYEKLTHAASRFVAP
jgi:hypothetical protein